MGHTIIDPLSRTHTKQIDMFKLVVVTTLINYKIVCNSNDIFIAISKISVDFNFMLRSKLRYHVMCITLLLRLLHVWSLKQNAKKKNNTLKAARRAKIVSAFVLHLLLRVWWAKTQRPLN